jgi:hypothetical protein
VVEHRGDLGTFWFRLPREAAGGVSQTARGGSSCCRWETDWKSQIKYTVLFGTEQFVTEMRKLLRGDRDQQTGLRRASVEALSWTEIVRSVSAVWGKPWEELLRSRGSGAREAALFLGRIHGRLSLKELGVLAGGLHHNAVSIAIRRLVERLKRDPDLQRRLSAVQKILSKT